MPGILGLHNTYASRIHYKVNEAILLALLYVPKHVLAPLWDMTNLGETLQHILHNLYFQLF